jgi:hypothetical protein
MSVHDIERDPVPVAVWGKDHWSMLAYIECRCVDHRGVPARARMRTDARRHPGLVVRVFTKQYPTRLAGGVELADHDDWDCADDIEAAGFIEIKGTGIHPVWKMTAEGNRVAGLLRAHKTNGGNFAEFKLT